MIKIKRLLWLCFFFVMGFNAELCAKLNINGANFDQFSRIEFDWQKSVKYEIKNMGREIFITFSDIVDEDPTILEKVLPNYISGVYLSADLKTVVIKLLDDFKIRDFTKNGIVYIDIVGQGDYDLNRMLKTISTPEQKSLTKSLLLVPKSKPKQEKLLVPVTAKSEIDGNKPKALPVTKEKTKVIERKPVDMPSLKLRAGDHDSYYRMVFEWDRPIKYRINEIRDYLEVRFSMDGKVTNKEIMKRLPEALDGFYYKTKGKNLFAYVPIKSGAVFKDSLLGKNRVVVDILKNDEPVLKIKEENPKIETNELEQIKMETPKVEIKSVEAVIPTPIRKEEVANTPEKVIEKLPEIEEKITPPKPFLEEDKIKSDSDFLGLVMSVKKSNPVNKDDKIATISLPFSTMQKIALFKRHGIWWLVINSKMEVNVDDILANAKDIIKEISIDNNKENQYTAVRMIMENDNMGFSVRQDGTSWFLDVYNGKVPPKNIITPVSQAGIYTGAKIFLPVRDAALPIIVTDPEIGDILKVVAIPSAEYGILNTAVYQGFEIIESTVGFAFALRVPDLNVNVTEFGIELMSKEGGLNLSSTNIDLKIAKEKEAKPSENKMSTLKLFDIAGMQVNNPDEYYRDLNKIKTEVYDLDKENRNKARLKLARFYLANYMVPEALGVLDIILVNDETIKSNAMFATMMGATNAMLNRYDEAIRWFKTKALEGNAEASLWLAYLQVMKDDSIENMEDYYQTFKDNISVLRDYPTVIRNKLAIQGLKVAVSLADEDMANDYIGTIIADDVKGQQKAAMLYYKGMMNSISGYFEQAFTFLDEATKSNSLYYRALASREKLKLEFKLNRISHLDVLKKLEQLRYSWRGDRFEYDVMNDLVDIYLSNENYGEALKILKDMTGVFTEKEHNLAVKKRMEDIFENLYLKGVADKLSPVKAIGIYNDFKEITPNGDKGNEMIRRLADRMVAVDLLDQASDLLQNQVDHRLKGKERAIVGARLALINIMNGKPAFAIKAIDYTDEEGLSERLKEQRRLIKAKALSEMGKNDEAVKLIKDDDTSEAKLLRVEILWSAKKWNDVSEVLRSMIKKPTKGQPLDNGQAEIIIDWATALRLASKEKVLLRVRDNFEPYMKGTKYYDAFNLLTDVSDSGTSYLKFAEQIKSAEGFKMFMNSYINKMKDDGLSETIK